MANQLHDTGEEYVLRTLDGETNVVGLYNDSVDQLLDGEDVGDITTEPTGSYARQNTTFTLQKNQNDNWELLLSDVEFDTSNSSQEVDSGFVVVNFQSEDTNDTSANDHLLFTFPIEDSNGNQTSLDLTNFNSLSLSGQSISID